MMMEGLSFKEKRALKEKEHLLESGEFLVTSGNISNIQRQGYYGKDGLEVGYAAKWIGDGYCVRSLDEPNLDRDL